MTFIKIVQNLLTNRPNSTSNMLLGRWNLKNNQNISGVLANMDSCGDRLCGDMDKVRKAIRVYMLKK